VVAVECGSLLPLFRLPPKRTRLLTEIASGRKAAASRCTPYALLLSRMESHGRLLRRRRKVLGLYAASRYRCYSAAKLSAARSDDLSQVHTYWSGGRSRNACRFLAFCACRFNCWTWHRHSALALGLSYPLGRADDRFWSWFRVSMAQAKEKPQSSSASLVRPASLTNSKSARRSACGSPPGGA
jgi:hypothetical protein